MTYTIKDFATVGGFLGGIAGAGIAVWGGYEIGTAVNNGVQLTGTAGRAVVDFVVVCTAMAPCIGIGYFAGTLAGIGSGCVYALVTGESKPKMINFGKSRARTYEPRKPFESLSNPLRNIEQENKLCLKNTNTISSQDNPEDLGSKINELED